MEPIELSLQERSKLCEVLQYCMETNANCNQNFKGDWDADCFKEDQEEMRALFQKLEYKPVQRHGWMVVYLDGTKRGMFDTQSEAEGWLIGDRGGKAVKVHWEE